MQSFVRRLNKAERRARNIDKVDAIRRNWYLFTSMEKKKSYVNDKDAELLGNILKKEFNYSNNTYWWDILVHFIRLYKTLKA